MGTRVLNIHDARDFPHYAVKGRKPRGGAITPDMIVKACEASFIQESSPKSCFLKRIIDAGRVLLGVAEGEFNPYFFSDEDYVEVDMVELTRVIMVDATDQLKYITDDFDCDDFAFRLMGAFHSDPKTWAYPIFITWVYFTQNKQVYGHAVLSFYYEGRMLIIEPQNDSIFEVPKGWVLDLLCG